MGGSSEGGKEGKEEDATEAKRRIRTTNTTTPPTIVPDRAKGSKVKTVNSSPTITESVKNLYLHHKQKQTTMADLLGIGTIATGLMNTVSQHFTNKQAQKYNTWMYNQQQQDQLKNWNLQNAYNTPQEQMKRLKAAGLNPNMVYGGGGATTTAQPIQKASPGSWNPQAPQLNEGILAMIVNMQKTQQATDNLRAQERLLDKQRELAITTNNAKLLGMQKTQWDMNRGNILLPYQTSALEANIHRTNANTEFTKAQQAINKLVADNNIQQGLQKIAESVARVRQMDISAKEIRARIAHLGQLDKILEEDYKLKARGFTWSDPWAIRAGLSIVDQMFKPSITDDEIYNRAPDKKGYTPRWMKQYGEK